MVNGGLRVLPATSFRGTRCANPESGFNHAGCPGMTKSFAIDVRRIELPVRIHKRQPRATVSRFDLAVEAGMPAGVACSALLLDPNPDRVLIAIQAHLDHALGLT